MAITEGSKLNSAKVYRQDVHTDLEVNFFEIY